MSIRFLIKSFFLKVILLYPVINDNDILGVERNLDNEIIKIIRKGLIKCQ